MACEAGGLVGGLCEVFVPQTGVGARVEGLKSSLEGKFPFSLASDLGSFFSGGGAGEPGALPTSVGWIPVPIDDLSAFFAMAKTAITLLIVVGFMWWLIDRLTPQVTI